MRATRLFALLLILSAGSAAPAGAAIPFASEGSTCGVPGFLGLGRIPGCPHVGQQGDLAPLACAADACAIHVRAAAEAHGLPLADKRLDVRVHFAGDTVPLGVVCATTGAAVPLACAGEEDVSVPLADGACRDVVVRASLENLGAVPGVLGVVTQVAFTLCRAGADLHATR